MTIKLPANVRKIIDILVAGGFEAYAVGGCVRDSIISRIPGDWDITTSATPQQVKGLFRRTIDTGIEHGTVTVMLGGEGYEVTTYRIDGEYKDGRHPECVEFTASLREDLKRRDFTINAMAYNDKDGIVDEFEGMKDLEAKVIRCVGDATERFSEDALRMLRAVRFSAQLGFTIEGNTAQAIEELAPTIAKVSKERIHTEFGKTLLSDRPEYILRTVELGLAQYAFEEFCEADHPLAMELVRRVRKDLGFRYAAMLSGLDEQKIMNALRKLKLDNATIKKAGFLTEFVSTPATDDVVAIRHLASRYSVLQVYDGIEYAIEYNMVLGKMETADILMKEKSILDKIVERGDCLDIKNLAIKGSDLKELGINPGRMMGETLKNCLEYVLCNPEYNTARDLIEYVKRTSS